MMIGIDANEANIETRVGIGTFAFNVLGEIYKKAQSSKLKAQNGNLKLVSSEVEGFKIYLKDEPRKDLPPTTGFWSYQIIKPARLWTQVSLPLKLWQEKILGYAPDVFLSLTHYAPRFCPVPTVMCIMDLAFLKFPEFFLKKDLFQLKNWTEYSVKQAKKIITISESSKSDIIKYYGIAKEKIVVAYPGYDRNKFKVQSSKFKVEEIKKKYKIDSPYILYVGTIQPRKNLARLIEAFEMLKQVQHDMATTDFKLVICGMMKEGRGGWKQEELFKKIRNSKFEIRNSIILTGYVPEEDLPYLMVGAKALVLPSLYEGFGIPVVEAMAYGVPTVVSNVSSLPEIVGKAGILVDPYDVESIALGIKEACYNKSKREEMIKKGLEQVKKFSWEKSAAKILEVLIMSSRAKRSL